MIVNKKVKNRIVGFRIGYRMDSDHLPLIVALKEGEERRRKEEEEKKGEERGQDEEQEAEIILWNKEAIKEYKKKTQRRSAVWR